MDNQPTTFWDRVSSILAERNLSKAELARRAGLKSQSISKALIARSMPQADTAFKIAEALNVSVEYLMYGTLDYDTELEESFAMLRKSARGSMIARVIPLLSSDQMSVIETLFKSWGFCDLLDP